MSESVRQTCQTVAEHISIVILIHKYYVTDMTAKQCQTMSESVRQALKQLQNMLV